MSDQNNTSSDAEIFVSPAWLDDAVRLTREANLFGEAEVNPSFLTKEFRDRCSAAAEVALGIARLREERERIGFVPLSFAEYVQGLVKVADVRLDAVLAWLKIDDLARPSASAAQAVARLARAIGVGVREALLHVRIGFASQVDSAPLPMLLARYRGTGGGGGELEECEVALGLIESEYSLEYLSELHELESRIRAAYGDEGRSE